MIPKSDKGIIGEKITDQYLMEIDIDAKNLSKMLATGIQQYIERLIYITNKQLLFKKTRLVMKINVIFHTNRIRDIV